MRCRNCRVRASVGSRQHLRRRPRLEHHAAVDEQHLVGHLLGEPDLVGHDDHRPALLGQVLDHLQHLADELRVQRRGRLVEQHELGPQRQRAGDPDALLLAARELVGVLVRLLRQADLGQQRQRLLAGLGLRPRLHHDRPLEHVLQHLHVREQVVALEDHPALRAEARQGGAVRRGRRSRRTGRRS